VRDEYVKIAALRLDVDEKSLKNELSNYISEENNLFGEKRLQIVTKTSNKLEKAQKNLLSMYLINESNFSIQILNSSLKNIEFTNEKLIIVKNTIDKLFQRVNNVKDLIETLYTEFAEDNDLKEIITDLIYLSDSFKSLSDKDFKIAINENIDKINSFKRKEAENHLRSQYKEVNDDDIQAVEIQMKLREQLKDKLRTGDN
jgi:hypothetical protein